MTRVIHRMSSVLLFVAACHPADPSAAPTTSPEEQSVLESESPELVDDPPGSTSDLRARGAFRAEDGEGRGSDEDVPSELADRGLTMTVQTQAADRSWWALAAGGQLRSGEVLVVEVELYQPAHVYVINVSASGRSTLLYPDAKHEQDTRLDCGAHRLPPKRSDSPYIKMDAEVGTEHLLIIATPAPIRDVDGELGEIVAKLQRGESPMVVIRDERSPPKQRAAGRPRTRQTIDEALFEANAAVAPELRSRGGYRTRADGAAIDAKAGADGVIVVPFKLEHI